MFFNKAVCLAFFIITSVANLVCAQSPYICTHTPSTSPIQMDVTIDHNQFKLDKGPGAANWHARGFVIRAFVTTTEYAQAHETTTYNAQMAYGPDELDLINTWGTSMLRFLVSEKVLSNDQTWYTQAQRANYMTCLKNALQLARNKGYVVDIAMQAEDAAGDSTGSNKRAGQPTIQTQHAWEAINGWFKNDKGVIYELYNEPSPGINDSNWNIYLHDGDSANGILSISSLKNDLRGLGSTNVLIVDGLNLASSLNGILDSGVVNAGGYPLYDPLINGTTITTAQIGYAVHTYPDGNTLTTADFDQRFGNEQSQIPVIVTEWAGWGTPVGDTGLGLAGTSVSQLIDFINYVNTKKIGLGASAFDIPNVMVLAITPQGGTPPANAWMPTYFNCYVTGETQVVTPTPNVGTLIKNFFGHDYDSTTYVRANANATGISCP